MTDENKPKSGMEEALTLLNSQELEAAFEAVAQADEEPPDDQFALMFSDSEDSLAKLAEVPNAARRGAGRPKGSANRRNSDLFEVAMKLGFKHPFVRLMEIVSADPSSLGVARLEALKLQIRAAEVLLPYDMAKKPLAIEVNKQTVHMFIAGKLEVEAPVAKSFSLTGNIEEDQ